MGSGRFLALEGMRAIMALWVVLGHCLAQSRFPKGSFPWPVSIIGLPGLAVVVFMIMSGFVISNLVLSGKETYTTYIARRWLRLFPLMAVCVVAGLTLHLLGIVSARFDPERIWQYSLAYLTMMHGAVPNEILSDAARAFLPPAWSISLEWQFYLVAPLLILILNKRMYFLFATLALLAYTVPATKIVIGDISATFPYGSFLPMSLTYFLIGIGSYHVMMLAPRVNIPLSACGAIVIVTLAATNSYPVAIWAICLLAMFNNDTLGNALSGQTLSYLGKISFSIYLVHNMVMGAIDIQLLSGLIPSGTWLYFMMLSTSTLILTIGISHFTYKYIEKPCIQFGKKYVNFSNPNADIPDALAVPSTTKALLPI